MLYALSSAHGMRKKGTEKGRKDGQYHRSGSSNAAQPGKPEGMHYLSHQRVYTAHGIVVDVAVTPGNTSDSEPYLTRIEHMRSHLGLDNKTTGADSTYGNSLIYRRWRIWEFVCIRQK